MALRFGWLVFGVLVCLFVLAVTPLGRLLHLQGDFRNFVIPFGVLGLALLILSALSNMSGLLKIFLSVTGASAVLWPASLYLHSILIRFFPTEPVTYILFFYVSTSAFIIGAVGVMIIGIKELVSSH
jgi:hypothetical protein